MTNIHKRKTNAKTATAVAAVVGTILQPSSSLHTPRGSPSSGIMRHRRLAATTSSSSSSSSSLTRTSPQASWGGLVSVSSRSVSRKSGCIGLSKSPFDGETYGDRNETSVLLETMAPPTTKIRGDKNDNGLVPDASNAASNDGDRESSASGANFEIPLAAVDAEIGDADDEGRRLAAASEKLIRFLREEAPPISIVLLNFVAVIWGSQHAIIKTVVEDSDPAAFTFLRFGLASLIASPYLPGVKEILQKTTHQIVAIENNNDNDNDNDNDNIDVNNNNKDIINKMSDEKTDLWKPWRWGIEMGLWMFLGFSLQAIGLQSTTAQRSGFLLYLNVKFVPFFAYVLLGRQISKWTWLSALAAFSGTALLALDGKSLGLNVGDVWSVMAAAASAMFILRLEKASSEVPRASELNATSLLVVATLSGAWLLLLGGSAPRIASEVTRTALEHPLELVYLGAVSTALANFIQAKAQKDVPAERASIIYSLDPVYGAFFSWIILGETLGGPQAYIGASIIFAAAATNSLLEFSKGEEVKE